MKGLFAGMTPAAIRQNKKVSILLPVFSWFLSGESLRSFALSEVEVQPFGEEPDTCEWVRRAANGGA